MASKISRELGLETPIVQASAENIPFSDGSFDFVHAESVIEHAADAQKVFNETHRILRASGVFWFHTASSLCPRQEEIRGFPMFGWYPDKLKQRIMRWASQRRPELIGHTGTPAINWFTPAKARRMLAQAGFTKIYDRWDLRLKTEGGMLHGLALEVMRHCPPAKLLANILIQGCSFAAVK